MKEASLNTLIMGRFFFFFFLVLVITGTADSQRWAYW